jgi:Cys-tRNA(Pro)/Cys-tRNA(Cys) deacylase
MSSSETPDGKHFLDLEHFLKEKQVWYNFLVKPETVHTADASRQTGIPLSKITKNLVCRDDSNSYALLVVPGDRRVNLRKAADALNKENVKLVAFEEAESVSGYPPGGTPSVHHKTKMTVVLDKSLQGRETIFCGGGTRDKLLELKTEDLTKLENVVVADISQ